MRDENMDVLGACDEAELIELSEADTNGGVIGTSVVISVEITIGISETFCPTTVCTSQCNAT